jgi:hypothetical protein
MLTRKPSHLLDDAQAGNPLFQFQSQGMPAAYSLVPPTPFASEGWQDGDHEACRLISVNLAAYIDNELDPDQADLVTQHLNGCTGCAALLDTMERTDETIEREWRESAPLPSSSQFRQSIDSIMDALPPAPAQSDGFAAKRVHARTRWMRFATGMSGFILAAGALWSSYNIGYSQGRNSARRSSIALPAGSRYIPGISTALTLCSLSEPPPTRPLIEPSLTFARERRSQR